MGREPTENREQRTENKGTREQARTKNQEPIGNKGTKERGNKGTKECGNPGANN
jgi:hypothetical protein